MPSTRPHEQNWQFRERQRHGLKPTVFTVKLKAAEGTIEASRARRNICSDSGATVTITKRRLPGSNVRA